jgi:hypothetical protein
VGNVRGGIAKTLAAPKPTSIDLLSAFSRLYASCVETPESMARMPTCACTAVARSPQAWGQSLAYSARLAAATPQSSSAMARQSRGQKSAASAAAQSRSQHERVAVRGQCARAAAGVRIGCGQYIAGATGAVASLSHAVSEKRTAQSPADGLRGACQSRPTAPPAV